MGRDLAPLNPKRKDDKQVQDMNSDLERAREYSNKTQQRYYGNLCQKRKEVCLERNPARGSNLITPSSVSVTTVGIIIFLLALAALLTWFSIKARQEAGILKTQLKELGEKVVSLSPEKE